MRGPYSVGAYDKCGPLAEHAASDFVSLLVVAHNLARSYPDACIVGANVDRCDVDTNGLTEEESELLQTEVETARTRGAGGK